MFIPEMKPRLNLVISKDNKIISDTDVEAHSFVRNWYARCASHGCFVNSRTAMNFGLIGTNGSSYVSDTNVMGRPYEVSYFIPGSGVTTFGLTVGNSDTAWAFTQYALSGLIAHGTGAGELGYAAQSTTTKSDTDDTRTITISRVFNNTSGGDVTVREIGWGLNGWGGSSYSGYFMLFREVLDTPVVLTDAQQLTVNFMIDLTYPETIS